MHDFALFVIAISAGVALGNMLTAIVAALLTDEPETDV
jgi:hypothetical protein